MSDQNTAEESTARPGSAVPSLNELSSAEPGPALVDAWVAANLAQIEAEMARLSLVLQRKILWLRQLWKRDPLQDFREVMISDAEADRLLAGDDWNAERAFYESAAAAELSRAIAAQKEKSMAAGRQAIASGSPPALEILARLFHLDPLDIEVILLCLAPELDPGFDRLYAYIQDDATRRYPTPSVALQIWGQHFFPSEAEVWSQGWKHFLPDAALRRSHLIRWESPSGRPRPGDPIRLERRVCDYLLGVNRVDEEAPLVLRPVETHGPPAVASGTVSHRLEQLLRQWNGRGRMPAVNLVGKSAAGRSVAAHLCAHLGIGLYAIDPARLPAAPRERRDLFRVLERDAVLLPSAFLLDLTELDKNDRGALALAQELILDLRSFLIVVSRTPWHNERGLVAVEVPKLSTADQHELWKSVLGDGIAIDQTSSIGQTLEDFVNSLVQQFDFDASQIVHASESARASAQLQDPSSTKLTAGDVWKAARGQFSDTLAGLAERVTPIFRFEDLVLPEETLQQLRDISAQVTRRAQVYERWGFGERLSRGRGIAALFAGPSGTGKTMAAEVLANTLSLDLYRVDLSGVVSKYIGETEKNLRSVFDAAEESGAILFFDEADALFGKRSEVHDSHDRYANIEINYLLQRMEDYRGLAILATNMKSLLDQAFLRRLRFLVEFPFPSPAQRKRIWQGVFPAAAEKEAFDYDFLSRLEIAGGNIKNIAINSAFLAAAEGKPIGMQHVLAAAKREYSKIDKLVLASEFGSYFRRCGDEAVRN